MNLFYNGTLLDMFWNGLLTRTFWVVDEDVLERVVDKLVLVRDVAEKVRD